MKKVKKKITLNKTTVVNMHEVQGGKEQSTASVVILTRGIAYTIDIASKLVC